LACFIILSFYLSCPANSLSATVLPTNSKTQRPSKDVRIPETSMVGANDHQQINKTFESVNQLELSKFAKRTIKRPERLNFTKISRPSSIVENVSKIY